MLRATLFTPLFAGLLCLASTPALADAPAAAATHALTTADTTIGDLLDNPAARAVIDKNLPGFSTNPQIEMARSLTLKQLQGFSPESFTDAVLAKIDADLAALNTK